MTQAEIDEKLRGRTMMAEEINEILRGITLSNGTSAADYVIGLPEMHKEVATQAILNVSQKGWPLNDLEITSEARELNRKKLGIK